ncbi:MAG: hypothetical protein AAF501_09285 [Pseudomonadota bacterium]
MTKAGGAAGLTAPLEVPGPRYGLRGLLDAADTSEAVRSRRVDSLGCGEGSAGV